MLQKLVYSLRVDAERAVLARCVADAVGAWFIPTDNLASNCSGGGSRLNFYIASRIPLDAERCTC